MMPINASHRAIYAATAVACCAALPSLSQARTVIDACSLAKGERRGELIHAPFRAVDGRIYVETLVEGRGPYIFALDTGASGMGRADAGLVKALGLQAAGKGQSSDGVTSKEVDLVKVGSVQFGRLVRRDLEIIARDYRSRLSPAAAFAGILGRDFFADGLLIINYPTSTVSFTRQRRLQADMRGALIYETAFRIPITIGKVTTQGNLDTGANVALVLPKSLYDQISREALKDTRSSSLMNTRIETGRATMTGPVRVGNVSSSDVPVRVSETFPEVLIGAHFLQNRIVLIDQRTKSVALCPAVATALQR